MSPTTVRGRAASEQALVSAAASLFEEVGPNAVSVRAIAERAGVNHGLVHHYFGSKSGLVQAVLERLAEESAAAIRERGVDAVIDPEDGRVRRHVRVLARVVLDDAAPEGFQAEFPIVAYLSGLGRDTLGLDDQTSRLRASQVVALMTGWLILEPWLLASADLGPEAAGSARADLQAAMVRLATG
ncbi:MAG: TetR/AcrR family transcriptional regulator [Candidatus Nanopelagicales bacterium]